ncbi:Hsp20/alpha crystallin family protein [Metabacillus sp. RGM 3146]|uniref:Hsp20/alpha crystallin family protein n=1 Tax=Metabacillus sp. RGM 3146 TaxID=3401092 RepID=UPI003B9D7C68
MDVEKIKKWLALTEKYHQNDFWDSIFDENEMMRSQETSQKRTDAAPFPKYDIFHGETAVVVIVELPGIKKENLVTALDPSGTILKIKGMMYPPFSFQTIVSSERYYGEFKRSIKLPFPAVKESVQSFIQDGLLQITYTKRLEEPALSMENDDMNINPN